MGTAGVTKLPRLDLRRFDRDAAERAGFLNELREAARELGFFYLEGHGIPPELIDRVRSEARAFFALPESDKLSIEMVNSAQFRGYSRPGAELTRGRPDWREQIDVGAERPTRTLKPGDPPWARLEGPNQWPAALPSLRPVLLRYLDEVTVLGVRLVQAFAAALGQDEDALAQIYTPAPNQLLKIIRYPGRDRTDSDQGVGAHKDSGLVTILLQDAQSGLQVEGPDGWIDAPPLDGSFIINTGELFEMASDGYLRANVHRVVTPPAGAERLSIAFFLGARLDATVPFLDVPPELAALRRGVTSDPANPLFREVGRNFLKSRLRSHPDVASRWHADLLETASPARQPVPA